MASDSVSAAEKVEEGLGWFSNLPDELVVKVVSFCSLKDAIRTSVLSRRWRNLWKSADLALEFDASEELMAVRRSPINEWESILASKRKWFKNWVNGVVRQLQQDSNSPHSRLTKFRVLFSLIKRCNSEGDIDRWLEFAISKRVESLDIAFYTGFPGDWECYVFSQDCFNHIKTPAGLSQINHLRSLRLSDVDLTDEILEHLLAHCTLLEDLVVKHSKSLERLRVVGSSHSPLPLKYLELECCPRLVSLKISHAPQLVRCRCVGSFFQEELQVGNCTSLVDMAVGLGIHASSLFTSLSGCASQLVTLSIVAELLDVPLTSMAEYTCLKRLGFSTWVSGSGSILWLIPLINACPRLHTLQLNMYAFNDTGDLDPSRNAGLDHLVKLSRESIKVVEIVGFRGFVVDREFVEYVLEYFVGLERIVIDLDLTPPSSRDSNFDAKSRSWRCSKEQGCEAERIALGYKSKAPSKLEFVVI
ncbi:Putative F-box/LRR-repeat protein At5g25860 [Linum perenne]